MTDGTVTPILERYRVLQARIEALLAHVGRTRSSLTLVAVSKYARIEQMRTLVDAGLGDFGENRVQEALLKQQALAGYAIEWHFTGHLQVNKVKRVVGAFALIHSVDSLRLAEALNREALRRGLVQSILVQVNVSRELTKQGVPVERAIEVVSAIVKQMPGLRVMGFMAMAPQTVDSEISRACFRELRVLRDRCRARMPAGVLLQHLSMGMTQDFEVAIEEGATMIRIGSGLFVD